MREREARFEALMKNPPGLLANHVISLEAEVRALKATLKTIAELAVLASTSNK